MTTIAPALFSGLSILLMVASPSTADSKRLPEPTRRTIYAELVRAEDRAYREAEVRHPTNPRTVPRDQLLAQHELKVAELKKLMVQYKRELCAKHRISAAELQEIVDEARARDWPLPPAAR